MPHWRKALPVAVALISACGQAVDPLPPPSLPGSRQTHGDGSLRYEVPGGWISERTRSNLRKAQYRVPDKDGQEEAAEFVVFHFGPSAGSLEQNLERARSQILPDDESGDPIEASFETAGLHVSMLDMQGTYSDQLSGETRPDHRMLWACVSTPAGPYFFKLVGPRGTVSDWAAEFASVLRSLQFDERRPASDTGRAGPP